MKAFMCFQNNWLDLTRDSLKLDTNSFDNLFAQI